jgi:hypothetical protein
MEDGKMFCAKCGSQMADDAAFCPACGAKNVENGQQQPLQTNHQAQQKITPQNFYQPQQSYQQVQPQYSPVQKPDKRKNRQTLIIIAAVVAVLLIVAVLATVFFLKRLKDDDNSDKYTRRTTRNEQKLSSEEPTETTTAVTTTPTSSIVETSEEITQTTTTTESSMPPEMLDDVGIVPDYVWDNADFEAELIYYQGHYQGTITTRTGNLEAVEALYSPENLQVTELMQEANGTALFTDLFVGEDYLECFAEHPLSSDDGTFLYLYPLELTAGGYFQEYADEDFDDENIIQYGFMQTAFYQLPDQQLPSLYILYYEEYSDDSDTGFIEVRIDVTLTDYQ